MKWEKKTQKDKRTEQKEEMQPVRKIKKKDRIDIIIEYTKNITLTFFSQFVNYKFLA